MIELKSFIEKIKTNKKQKRIFNVIAGILSCFIVVFTFYLLSPTAFTEEKSEYKFYLRDGYYPQVVDCTDDDSDCVNGKKTINSEFAWKEGKQINFDLKLYYYDTDGNVIKGLGKDLTLNIAPDGFANDPYKFGRRPEEGGVARGKDLVEAFNIKYLTNRINGDIYEFDHLEVKVDGTWHKFNKNIGSWDLWCNDANATSSSTYGWVGRYGDNGDIVYHINDTTEYKIVYRLSVVNTVSDASIKMRVFDYDGYNDDRNGNNVNANGLYKYFTFRNPQQLDKVLANSYLNEATDADGFIDSGDLYKRRAHVLRKLDSYGYPVFDCRGASGCNNSSMGYLFGSATNAIGNPTQGVKAYSPKNTLLQKSSDGSYHYDSSKNAADYDTTNNRFLVRNYVEHNEVMEGYVNEKSRHEFMPFNYANITDDSKVYVHKTKDVNYWHGMTMEFNFYMPKNGQIDGKDMIFEFSGDDDVWVFIDDVLVLDLGGTHGAVDGKINFKTGEVTSGLNWNGDKINAPTTNIYEQYQKANAVDSTSWNGKTYKDYTMHSVKFFFLERGSAVSNCSIKFNMPVLPTGTLTVEKQLEGPNRYNEEYTFQVYDVTNNRPHANAKYKIGSNVYTTDNEGKFKLKANEKALFELTNYTNYYVSEVDSGIYAEPLKCTLNGLDSNCETITKTNSFESNPESAHYAIFTNKTTCNDLVIKKIVEEENPTNEKFKFKIKLLDSNNNAITSFRNSSDFVIEDGYIKFNLGHNESVKLEGIEFGTRVKIEEIGAPGYTHVIKLGGVAIPNGTFTLKDVDTDAILATVYNTPGVILPETGGPGKLMWILTGISLMLVPFVYKYNYLLRKKK